MNTLLELHYRRVSDTRPERSAEATLHWTVAVTHNLQSKNK